MDNNLSSGDDPMIHATDALSFTAHVGRKCWVDMPHMAGAFPGDVMLAQVVEGHRPAREGMAWVRQLPTPALPFPGEEGGWVSEQPLTRMMDAR